MPFFWFFFWQQEHKGVGFWRHVLCHINSQVRICSGYLVMSLSLTICNNPFPKLTANWNQDVPCVKPRDNTGTTRLLSPFLFFSCIIRTLLHSSCLSLVVLIGIGITCWMIVAIQLLPSLIIIAHCAAPKLYQQLPFEYLGRKLQNCLQWLHGRIAKAR